jgi:hypothetical protein
VSVVSSRGIFLSYRRADAAPYARLLQFQLRERFPDMHIFMDLDSIEAGLDFAEVIGEAVDSCGLLVALIGRQWLSLTDEQGRRRLDNPGDYVRFEVQTALERGVRVIPVLVDGAKPPRSEQLPAGLRRLARLNALELSYGRYEYDADQLLELIQRVLAATSNAGITLGPSPAVKADDLAASDNVRSKDISDSQTFQQPAEFRRRDRAHAIRLLIDAKRAAESINVDYQKATALAAVARAMAATDPSRASRAIADAERITQSITRAVYKVQALVAIAESLVNVRLSVSQLRGARRRAAVS